MYLTSYLTSFCIMVYWLYMHIALSYLSLEPLGGTVGSVIPAQQGLAHHGVADSSKDRMHSLGAARTQLKTSAKTPVSLQKMYQMLTELQDQFADSSLVQRFHALPTQNQNQVTTWKLQLSTRADAPYHLLHHLAFSQVWTMVATSLKPHSLHQSNLSTTLETNLGLKKPKGQGKGKNKPRPSPPQNQTKKEST